MSLNGDYVAQIEKVLKAGIASYQKPTEEERESQIEIIKRVLAKAYNEWSISGSRKTPVLYWKSIYFLADEIIKDEITLGLWNHRRPQEESIRRSIQYAAKEERWKPELPPIRRVVDGYYCWNYELLDDETKLKLQKIIEEFKP